MKASPKFASQGYGLVMVGGAVAHPAATPEPDVTPFDRLRACFRVIRLFSRWAIVIRTVGRERHRGSGRAVTPG